jgi:2,3-bisphosphoglycerate-dependent phosphoglycerate mutase
VTTRLLLVRHGETSANLDGVWHGSTDTPLTERGRRQAERVAKYLAATCADASALYASDLQRARDTASAIAGALDLEVRTDAGLREYDLGAWEGRTYRELARVHRLWERMQADPHHAPHGGESPLAVAERLAGALRRIAATHAGQRVIVVSHGGALSLGLGLLLDGDPSRWHPVMDNCAVSELDLAEATALIRFNLTEHLAGV